MNCPYCRTAISETSPECPACRLTLDRASTLLGPIPRMQAGLSDLAGVIRSAGRQKIRKAIARLEWNFPQVHLHIVCHSFPVEYPLDLMVFWLFNSGALSGEHEKAGKNHTVLLVLDPGQKKGSLMVGYGLEPFISSSDLDSVLEKATPSFQKSDWVAGCLEVIAGLEFRMEKAATSIAAGFGLSALATAPSRDY